MSLQKNLRDYEEIIRECVKCGICLAHCPTYLINRKEGAAARGKIALAAALLDGEVDLEEKLLQDASMCLMCGSCLTKCPNKVPTNEIVGAIRREITDNQGLSVIGKGVSTVLGSPRLLNTIRKTGAVIAPLALKKVPETSGLRLRFPFPVMKGRTLPEIAYRNLFDRIPEFTQGRADKPVIGFFAGCAITHLYPEIGETMVAILNRMGFSILVPRQQRCCGIPALSSGNGRLVDELAQANREAFKRKDVDYIITACASCYGGLTSHYGTLKADFADFTAKVVEFSIFLKREGLFAELAGQDKWENRSLVTYHDPCHLRMHQITKEPRQLLRSLPNVDFVEMENAASCCGLGGTFSVYHYETSKAIGALKLAGLVESRAQIVATGCPGCIMQLQDTINHAGLKIKAVHLLDLVKEALS